ncbi:hypothetical protein SteCoe_31335 [Stentor coeruleus]|uniref:Uncharacterized protein n=1 Tax=Stentor coeruleus TaxID=5963 RepID=A0A1R2B1G4_9CILI|nr:hypothetical protein SteCoe_31335 [Stentor coeruleus]
MNSFEKPLPEKKPSKFSYNELVLDSEERSLSSRYMSPVLSPSNIPGSSSPKIFGNSARFYKAMKEFQNSSDVNVLKEELWASRKEITNLEKRLIEKTEEILELKKSPQSSTDMEKNSENFKKLLEKEMNLRKALEFENLKMKSKISDLMSSSSDNFSLVLGKVRNMVEFQSKKISFEYDTLVSKSMSKMREKEKKLVNIFGVVSKMLKGFKPRENEVKHDMELKVKNDEILELKKELAKNNRLYENKLEDTQQQRKLFQTKLESYQKSSEENTRKANSLQVENRLLNEITQELEKENIKLLKAYEQQTFKCKVYKSQVKDLRKSLTNLNQQSPIKSRSKSHHKAKSHHYYKELIKSLQTAIEVKNLKIQELTQELQTSEEKYQKLLQESSEKLENISNLNKSPKDDHHSIKSSTQLGELFDEKSLEINTLKENYEKLLYQYNNAQQELENHQNLKPKYTELEDKIIDLESELVISNNQIDKYKKILISNSISYDCDTPSKHSSEEI